MRFVIRRHHIFILFLDFKVFYYALNRCVGAL